MTDQATAPRRKQLERLGCEVVAFPGSGLVPIVPLLDELGRRGLTNVLVEGGGQTAGSFLDAGQVDAVDVFIAPSLEGGDHARTARSRSRTILDEPGEAISGDRERIGRPRHCASVDVCPNRGGSRRASAKAE